jgi:uncharacterized phage protein (TIGR01671 family)
MKPKFRAWSKVEKIMSDVKKIDFCNGEIDARSFEETEIEEVVLMQSTDIKDKSGKEIFEFDVVTTTRFLGDDDFNDKVYTGVVKRMQGSWVIDTGKKVMSLWSQLPGEENEVLGNMFENPNLVP